MFSSSPFPDVPMSPNVFISPNLLFDDEKDCVCFNYNHNNSQPFTSNGCFYHSPHTMENIISTSKQEFVSQQQKVSEGPCEDHCDLLDAVVSCSKCTKKSVEEKKDGRSKICTAQGRRDRRVRLSIEISRKFFCLQDLLGFDKASKTLDWLFTKSKKAIKELVEETNHGSCTAVSEQSNAEFLESIKEDFDEDEGKKKSVVAKCLEGKKKKLIRKSRSGYEEINLARDQSRVMARARARERTREKMNITKLNDEFKILVPDEFDSQIEL